MLHHRQGNVDHINRVLRNVTVNVVEAPGYHLLELIIASLVKTIIEKSLYAHHQATLLVDAECELVSQVVRTHNDCMTDATLSPQDFQMIAHPGMRDEQKNRGQNAPRP